MRALTFAAVLLLIVTGVRAADAPMRPSYPPILPSYPDVRPGVALHFPADHGAHPDFRTEWWYITGWLDTEDGRQLGFQVTFFRMRPAADESNPSAFAAKQILFAHAALSDPRWPFAARSTRGAGRFRIGASLDRRHGCRA